MIEFRAERPIWTDSVKLYGRDITDGVQRALIATGIELRAVENGELWPEFLSLPMVSDAAQSLFQALRNAGFRPHNGESSQAHVSAIKDHLADMRALVFRKEPQ